MKPLLVRKDTRRQQAAFVRKVRERDGDRCRLLRYHASGWRPCGRSATDTAHILPRRECGKAKFDPAVGIRACRECHEAFDRHSISVTPPHDLWRAAVSVVSKVSKLKPKVSRSR